MNEEEIHEAEMAERLSGMDDSKVVHDTMAIPMMKRQAANIS